MSNMCLSACLLNLQTVTFKDKSTIFLQFSFFYLQARTHLNSSVIYEYSTFLLLFPLSVSLPCFCRFTVVVSRSFLALFLFSCPTACLSAVPFVILDLIKCVPSPSLPLAICYLTSLHHLIIHVLLTNI